MADVSIIIPTFNRAELLREAVAALFQRHSAIFECLVVDDASTDQTRVVVEGLRRDFDRKSIRYFRQDRNRGAQAARNLGIREAGGDSMLFLDSDDVPVAEGIVALRDELKRRPELDYCFGKVCKTDAGLAPLKGERPIGGCFADEPREIAGYHWHTMGALYRRACVERVGPWNPALTGSQDWEYQARVKLSGARGKFLDTLVGFWRQHDGERVGTAEFRPDYVRSVMLACESIMSLARKTGCCDAELERRMAKRLLVHGLEWGANGYQEERGECFEMAVNVLRKSPGMARALGIASMLPGVLDGPLHRWVSGRTR